MKTRLLSLLETDADAVPLIARVALAVTILPHGAQKTLGWFGGYGFDATMQWFTQTMHIPWILAFAAVLAESLGALALLAGMGSRFAAAGIGSVYLVAATTSHLQHGFFMNWSGQQNGEGIEYFLLGLALAVIVLWRGGGVASVDRALTQRPVIPT